MSVEEMIMTIVALVVGFLGMSLTNYIKHKLGWSERAALALTGAVALVLALVQLVVANQLAPEMFSLEQLPGTFGLVFTTATVIYKLLSGTDEADGELIGDSAG